MRARTIVLLAVLALLWFGGLGQRSLIHPDEGRYAEIPREMLATGDWLTPRLNAIKYFEKPPLQYWATATGFAAFGLSEWSARLWPALTGFLTALLVAFTGRRLFGRDAGIAAGVITLGNIYFFAMGQVITLDMGLTFFMTAMLCATLIAQSGMGSRRRWMLLAWASAALAMLSKGLIALALPGAALVLFTLVARDPAIWRRLEIGWGLVVFLSIAAPWFIAVSIVNPEFPEFFFLHEHFARFTSGVHRRTGAWWYFIPVLIVGLVPWTVLMMAALWRGWREDWRAGGFKAAALLAVWSVVIFLFFSASGSKLPAYVLPMVPALALLAGRYATRLTAGQLFRQVAPVALIGGVGLIAGAEVARAIYAPRPDGPLYLAYLPWLQAAGGILALAAIGTYWLRAHKGRTIVTLALATIVAGQLLSIGFETLAPAYSARSIATVIRPRLTDSTRVYTVRMYEQTLPVYLGRTVTMVAHRDELSFGLEQEPERSLPTLDAFRRDWQREGKAIAVMSENTYAMLAAEGLPMQLIERSQRARFVVEKP